MKIPGADEAPGMISEGIGIQGRDLDTGKGFGYRAASSGVDQFAAGELLLR